MLGVVDGTSRVRGQLLAICSKCVLRRTYKLSKLGVLSWVDSVEPFDFQIWLGFWPSLTLGYFGLWIKIWSLFIVKVIGRVRIRSSVLSNYLFKLSLMSSYISIIFTIIHIMHLSVIHSIPWLLVLLYRL